MSQTNETKEPISSLVCPALNILRAIEMNMQEHECVYKPVVGKAINNLLKLMEVYR